MKYFASFLLLFVSLSLAAQEGRLPLDQYKHILYTDAGKPSATQQELYKRVQNWVVKSFGNYKNAVTFEDSTTGVLRITSYVPVIHAQYAYVRFDLTVTCKDNQYFADIKNLDGVSPIHSPVRLDYKENDAIAAREVLVNAETNRKAKAKMEEELKLMKADNEGINSALYNLLSGLKNSLI